MSDQPFIEHVDAQFEQLVNTIDTTAKNLAHDALKRAGLDFTPDQLRLIEVGIEAASIGYWRALSALPPVLDALRTIATPPN